MRPQRFDLIVFDWDGTLFDSTALIARSIQRSAQDLGLKVPSEADAKYVIGLGLRDALTHVLPDLVPERYQDLVARYRHRIEHAIGAVLVLLAAVLAAAALH